MVKESIRLPDGDDAAFIHYAGMVANAQCLTHIVVCYPYANITSTQLPDDLLDIHGRNRGNAGKRLVQQSNYLSTVDSQRDVIDNASGLIAFGKFVCAQYAQGGVGASSCMLLAGRVM